MKSTKILLLLLALVLLPARLAYADLINPSFETGDLSGWTVFTTVNGTLGDGFPQVVPFDTNNDSVASLAAQFRVGQLVPNAGVFAGGGIFQTVVLDAGRVLMSVDIATSAEGINLSAGLFQLIFDGVVVAEHDFGMINANTSEFGVLSHVTDVTAGSHEFRIQMGRSFLSGCGRGCTPAQFVDNARITPVPETASFPILLTLGIAGLAALRLGNL